MLSYDALQSEIETLDESTERFCFFCTSCQNSIPNHLCVISLEKPSSCGISWTSAERRPDFYIKADKGKEIDLDEYEGINETFRKHTKGRVKRVKLHSVLDHPVPSGYIKQTIIFYIPEEDAFGITDKNYPGKTPVGLSFKEMDKILNGGQTDGLLGSSYSYLKSAKFLMGEGGWDRVVWVSPSIEKFLRMSSFAIR